MKTNLFLVFLLIIFSFYYVKLQDIQYIDTINFGNTFKKINIHKEKGKYQIIGEFDSSYKEKYLYIYPLNRPLDAFEPNIAPFRIFFKEYTDEDENINYLESKYTTLDLNSGLYIKIEDLNFNKANIYIIIYEQCNFDFYYGYTTSISFPKFNYYTNFQLSQFILQKGKDIIVKYVTEQSYNEHLTILSKTSLRNFDFKVKGINQKGSYLYPNGFTLYVDKEKFTDESYSIEITIINKSTKDEILSLGYMHLTPEILFPNPIFNGMQLYLGNVENIIAILDNIGNIKNKERFYIYQASSKILRFYFLDSENYDVKYYETTKYSSSFSINVDVNNKQRFDFIDLSSNTSVYFQYLDLNQNEIAQQLAQPLVTGSPRSMTLPKQTSMYHFLPIEKESTYLHYYLKTNTPENILVTLENCTSYPENCGSIKKPTQYFNLLENIGLWYTIQSNNEELRIIRIYCENECSYDVLISYDNDPLFIYPDNSYSKFISDLGYDIFIIPVYNDFETYNIKSINIDLTILGGKADFSLYDSIDLDKQINCDSLKKTGTKQSCVINDSTFLKASYFTNHIFVKVEKDSNYKNTFYNLMYSNGQSKTKLLDNNIVNVESLSVSEEETFIFVASGDKSYISISTQSCNSKVAIDGNEKGTDKQHFYTISKGEHKIKVSIMSDNGICSNGFEEEVMLFTYSSDNSNILLSENTLVNTTFSGNEISFRHLFKPCQDYDNSFTIEVERLSNTIVTFDYTLEKISFDLLNQERESQIISQQLISTKNYEISNNQIDKICNNLDENEVCSLTMSFKHSSTSEKSFSLYLDKNGNNNARHLSNETLINNINSNSSKYYYIDLNNNNENEIIINSYGHDLEVSEFVYSDENKIDISSDNFKNYESKKYHRINQGQKTDCKKYCRLYVAIRVPSDPYNKEIFTSFSINHLIIKEKKSLTEVELPLNYFAQYDFSDSNTEINYFVKIYEKSNVNIEFYIIKQNEKDNSTLDVTIKEEGKADQPFDLSKGILNRVATKNLKINIKDTQGFKSTFKLKISGNRQALKSPIIPILSSYSEKCILSECYYIIDISPDNKAENIYFYVEETEYAVIYMQKLDYDASLSNYMDGTKQFEITSKNPEKIQRSNWYEYKIDEVKGYNLLVKVALPTGINEATFYASFYNRPNIVTLNYGEKRLFQIRKMNINDKMTFNIKKPTNSNTNKYRINIHSVKGNGIINTQKQSYPLGLDLSYKESISIVIDNDSSENIDLSVENDNNQKYGSIFAFTIEYIVTDQLFNEVIENKMNSFKFYKETSLDNIVFYMKANKTKINGVESYKDINMNVKIYTTESKYDIKASVVDEEFINKKKKEPDTQTNSPSIGTIKTFIQGGNNEDCELTLSKLEISNEYLNSSSNNLYIYIIFTKKVKDNNSNKVKIDLYPYEMPYNVKYHLPLAKNELFVQELPANSNNYQLLMSRSDLGVISNIVIEYIMPKSKKYNYYLYYDNNNQFTNQSENDFKYDDGSLLEEDYFSKKLISFFPNNQKLLNIIFNIRPNEPEKEKDLFVFKYGYIKSDSEKIYQEKGDSFNVTGKAKEVKFEVFAVEPKTVTGKTTLIFNAYLKDDIPDSVPDFQYLSLYLLFSEVKPVFTGTAIKIQENFKSTYKKLETEDITENGEYIFTCVAVVIDQEKVEYLGYKPVELQLGKNGFFKKLADYMKNHVLASILIIIIILFLIGIMVNICRAEKKGGRVSSVKVELDGQLMEDKEVN